ncbi:hypothetical protein ECBCE034MS14_1923 [Escherichia coli BCE034_MS-14]|nr:hypothetical protein ECBCE034MS14_1923 [Escherichia coli BCE034_MS-14]
MYVFSMQEDQPYSDTRWHEIPCVTLVQRDGGAVCARE